MYIGKPTRGLEFYNLLYQSVDFTSELGKIALESSKLEAEIINLLIRNKISGNYNRATLGTLINLAIKNKLIAKNEEIALDMVKKQRNYITHNIYALFNDKIDETIFEKKNLLDSDVYLYIERANQLKKDLIELVELIKNKEINYL